MEKCLPPNVEIQGLTLASMLYIGPISTLGIQRVCHLWMTAPKSAPIIAMSKSSTYDSVCKSLVTQFSNPKTSSTERDVIETINFVGSDK